MRLAAERRRGLLPPARGLREIGKGAAGGELACLLGDQVVVRRGAVAAEAGEVLLMMVQLTQEFGVVVEQGRDAGPTVQQAPDPDPGEQPDAELDAAGPMDAGEERVAPPPGAQLRGREVRVARVGGQEIGGGQHGELVVARRLPDVFDGADLADVATVDVERVGGVGRAPAGPRVEEPVGIARQVGALAIEEGEPAHERGLGGPQQPRPRLCRAARRPRRGRARSRRPGAKPARQRISLARPELPRAPAVLEPGIRQTSPDLRRRHLGKTSGIPGQIHCATRSS